MATNFDDMKLAVQALSGGKNTVILDDLGMPSIMVIIPQFNSSDVLTGATETVHPGFICDGVTFASVAVSKFQNIVMNGRAYSLPTQDPKANINANTARKYCKDKGEGWGLMPFSLWSAIALWCKKNGTMPHGNNNYGADHGYPHEKGVPTYYEGGRVCRCATGSGPVTWYHDHSPAGIADLNGNVSEWVDGMRLVDGEIQIIPYANCMAASADMGESSADWKGIKTNGSLVAPGTAGTLKYDFVSNKITLCTSITTHADDQRNTIFQDLAVAAGVEIPQIIKELALYPNDESGYEGDRFYMVNNGERFPNRGGNWGSTSNAGVVCTGLSHPRSSSSGNIGFRSAFYGEL